MGASEGVEGAAEERNEEVLGRRGRGTERELVRGCVIGREDARERGASAGCVLFGVAASTPPFTI